MTGRSSIYKNMFSGPYRSNLLANVLIVAIVAFAFGLESRNPDFYYFSIQEDEYLEWASFWAFLIASVVYLFAAIDYRRSVQQLPWFLVGVALFCFIVAMEEISWGQRLLGYRPPAYFLEHNYQQEFNFHNVIKTSYRKLAMLFAIACFGIVLPIAAKVSFFSRLFERLGIVAPGISLVPAYSAAFLLYVVYPLGHTGEWVEMMLGTSFLFSALQIRSRMRHETTEQGHAPASRMVVAAFVTVTGLGLLCAAGSRAQRDAHPATIEAARNEVLALSQDFERQLARSRCNLHKRLYTFVEKYGQARLRTGSFSALQTRGLPEERAEFFLDPWNSPYWIRDRCDKSSNRRVLFVYSFGPNRRRDSSRTEILGDDIGEHIAVK